MEITKSLKSIIQQAINLAGNSYRFAKEIGVKHTTVMLWVNGKTTHISGKVWQTKLLPKLQPLMTPE